MSVLASGHVHSLHVNSRQGPVRRTSTPVLGLVFALVVALLITLTGPTAKVGAAQARAAQLSSAQLSPAQFEGEFLRQLNAERSARGLAPLELQSDLVRASQAWTRSMAASGNLVHSSDGRAEIIAYGSNTGQITLAWMKSPGHRHLMVDPNLTFAGVGVTCDSSGRMWAAVQFRRLDTSLPTLSSSAPSPAVTPTEAGSNCKSNGDRQSVRRLYWAFFQRESDASGLDYWVNRQRQGSSLVDVADFFATSPEFLANYGQLNDREFVERVYSNVMGRKPDRSGYAFWVDQMADGLGRGELMVGFSESPEFVIRSGIS